MARTLIEWKNTVADAGVPVGQSMYWLRTSGESCEADRVYFLGLSDADKLSQSNTAKPASSTGWQGRNCGGTTDVDGLWQPDYTSGSDFVADDTSTGTSVNYNGFQLKAQYTTP